MSLAAYLKLKKPAAPATSFADEDIGGGPSANLVSGAILNEVFFRMSSEPASGSARVQRAKVFVANDHPTEDLQDAKIYLANALDNWGSNNQTVGIQSTATADTGQKCRFIGLDTNGDPIILEANVSGTALAATPDQLTRLDSVEIRDQATGVLTTLEGAGRIYRGGSVLLGEVPPSYHGASSEFDLWLPASLDDTTTSLDAGTDPDGVSWSRPRTVETAVSVANGGVLTAGSAQGVWQRWTLRPGTNPRFDLPIVIGVYGADFT